MILPDLSENGYIKDAIEVTYVSEHEVDRNLTTGKLLSLIRNAHSLEEATAYHQEHGQPLLKDALDQIMNAHRITPKHLIIESKIERSYLYHILSGERMPGRNIVLRIGFCLNVSLNEMNQLLRLAGFSGLYSKVQRDAVLIYALSQNMSMEAANRLLLEAGEAPLYQTESSSPETHP